MTADEIVAALERTPLLTIAEMRAAFDRPENCKAHGFYAWWLINVDTLPDVPTTPHPSEPVGLLYVGVGPGRATSLKRVLRDRLKDHTRHNTGQSTFRLDLASFLFEREGWRPYWTDRAMLTKEDNAALSTWQETNLHAQWVEVATPWEPEPSVIARMRPPLNRGHNESHPFYREVGKARDRFRDAARCPPTSGG
jgi:GIY-YIG catalytic domain